MNILANQKQTNRLREQIMLAGGMIGRRDS